METDSFVFEEQDFQFEKGPDFWQLSLKRSKVSRAKYKLYKYISVWLGALSTILLIPLVYLVFIHNPFKEKMLAADTSFIKVDYNQVINRLEHVKVSYLIHRSTSWPIPILMECHFLKNSVKLF